MTRLNVYAGPAGIYLLRRGPGDLPDPVLPGPAPGVGADPFGRFYEIPIAIQDRSFNEDGSLFYPDSREFFDQFAGPYIPDSDVSPIPFWQIGTEGGFLPTPVMLDQLLVSPSERADVIVDFTDLPVGTELYLINEGPDEPFGGGTPETDFPAADSETTGQVMKFVVVRSRATTTVKTLRG